MHRGDHEEGSELTSLASGRQFDQVPLNDATSLESDELVPAGDSHEQDFDPVLSNSLNSSLTGGSAPKATSTRWDRWRYWLNDPQNLHTVRIGKCLIATVLLFIAILLAAALSRHADDSSDEPEVYDVRLPLTVFPSLYTIHFNASLTAQTFAGEMWIAVSFVAGTNQILFHALDLSISDVYLTLDGSSTPIQPLTAGETGQYDLYLVKFDRTFIAGATGVLHMRYAGVILPTLAGFYLSTYTTSAGETRTIASTQFESTDARRAFPCFDEPSFKANFSLTITTEKERSVLSNMPLAVAQPIAVDERYNRWPFQTSLRMSTYLVAWCITDFVSRTKLTKRGIHVSVWTAVDKIDGVEVALEAGVKAIDRYEEFFQVLYPLPKSDQVAIPNFPVGAMENWGLVTYRESALLVNSSSVLSTEAMTEQNIVATVSHELAHQWFGNFVTMKWWSDLWLNEGFASYVEWTGIQAYDATWDADAQMVADSQTAALALDSSQYSHPVVQAVNDPAEIDSLFDALSYDKGCSLLRMLTNVIGESSLQAGLHDYLTAHAYGNAESEDLWRALSAAAPTTLGEDLSTFMHKFTQQVGYPVVTLSDDTANLVATQQRFIELPYEFQDPALRDTQKQYKWDLYLTMADADKTLPSIWFKSTEASVTIPYEATQEYLRLNVGRFGFYRVNYPESLWLALATALRDQEEPPFSNSDLVGALDDVWTLALAGQTSYTAAFAMTEFLSTNSEYTPWLSALSQLGRVSRLVSSKAEDTSLLNRYVVERLIHNNTLSTAPWTGFPKHLRNLLQALFVSSLVAYGDQPARAEAARLFSLFVNSGVQIAVNIRDAVYRVAIEEDADGSCWNFLYDQYRASIDPSESKRILRALTRSRDPVLLQRIMDWSIDTDRVKSQDTSRIIIYVALNPAGQSLAWQWVQANYAELFKRFGRASFTLSELIMRVIGTFTTQAELDQAKAFFQDKDLGTAKRALQQAYETVQVNIYWLSQRYPQFSAALKATMQ